MISLLLFIKKSNYRRYKRIGMFIILYLFTTFLIIPKTAPIFGREKIKNSELVKAHSVFYILTNRNYVRPALNKSISNIAKQLHQKHKGIRLVYLDANFPFIDKFPLLPHLSHNDGKKIDVTLIYKDEHGKITNKKPSVSGYGVFENPTSKEYNQIPICKEKGYWQYDFPKYLTFGIVNKDLKFSANGTRNLVNYIVNELSVGKLFIEPHLKTRMRLKNSKIRYHGCQAVRHDDHIHFQLK